jgi:hypothetical protein
MLGLVASILASSDGVMRHEGGLCRKVKRKGEPKEGRGVVGKAVGGRVRLYTWRRARLADEGWLRRHAGRGGR